MCSLRYHLLGLFLLLAVQPMAWAQEPAGHALKELVEKADGHLQARRCAEALAFYTSAFKIEPTPYLRWSLAETYECMAQPGKALEELEQYELRVKEKHRLVSRKQEDIDRFRERLRERLRPQTRVGVPSLRQHGQPPSGRPRWRIGLGAAALVAGTAMVGFGISGLTANGSCFDQPMAPALECDQIYNTHGIGAGLLAAGAALLISGAILLAWPVGRHSARP